MKKYRNHEQEGLSESRPQLSAAETKALARLVRKYGSRRLSPWRRSFPCDGRDVRLKNTATKRRKLYPRSRSQLSAAETKAMARLVRKYGIRTVIALAKVVPLRRPGRPSRGLLPYYERMHRTEWIEEQSEEHRKRGCTKPYTNAEIDVYEMLFGDDNLRDIDKFRKTSKKMRQQGRQDLIDLLQAMLKAAHNKGRRDLIEKLRHLQKQARPSRGAQIIRTLFFPPRRFVDG